MREINVLIFFLSSIYCIYGEQKCTKIITARFKAIEIAGKAGNKPLHPYKQEADSECVVRNVTHLHCREVIGIEVRIEQCILEVEGHSFCLFTIYVTVKKRGKLGYNHDRS